MADDFSYNVRGFKATWRDLVEFSGLLDHTVMTTSSHHHIRHRSELWSDAKKIDFLIDMFSKAGEAWVLAAMMRPGAEHITAVVAQPEIGHLVPSLPTTRLHIALLSSRYSCSVGTCGSGSCTRWGQGSIY
jgi:hypothetical protein